MFTLRKEIGEAEILPWGYGASYHEYRTRMVVCYPIPLNIVIAKWKKVVDWARCEAMHWGCRHEQEAMKLQFDNDMLCASERRAIDQSAEHRKKWQFASAQLDTANRLVAQQEMMLNAEILTFHLHN